MLYSGTDPKDENFSVFTFDDKKINIYFAEYQVGPYVIGTPVVVFDRNYLICLKKITKIKTR
jgi:hypothetical protein